MIVLRVRDACVLGVVNVMSTKAFHLRLDYH